MGSTSLYYISLSLGFGNGTHYIYTLIQAMCLNLRQGKHQFHSPCQTKKKHQKGHLKVSTSLFVLFGLLSVWLFTCIHFQQDLYCRQSRSSLPNLPGRKTDVHPKKTPARKSTTSSNQLWHTYTQP